MGKIKDETKNKIIGQVNGYLKDCPQINCEEKLYWKWLRDSPAKKKR